MTVLSFFTWWLSSKTLLRDIKAYVQHPYPSVDMAYMKLLNMNGIYAPQTNITREYWSLLEGSLQKNMYTFRSVIIDEL